MIKVTYILFISRFYALTTAYLQYDWEINDINKGNSALKIAFRFDRECHRFIDNQGLQYVLETFLPYYSSNCKSSTNNKPNYKANPTMFIVFFYVLSLFHTC